MTISYPAFCFDGCSKYLELDIPSYKEVFDIQGKQCPLCREGNLAPLYPGGYSDELMHREDIVHKFLRLSTYQYSFDGVEHFICVVNEQCVFFVGYELSRDRYGWLYKTPEDTKEIEAHKVCWDNYELKIDGEIVYSPQSIIARMIRTE